jgi:hypothetical protein
VLSSLWVVSGMVLSSSASVGALIEVFCSM